mgnify:CR=1 FL=1
MAEQIYEFWVIFVVNKRLTIGIMDQKVHVLFYDNSNAMEPSLFNEVTEEDLISVKQEMNQIIEVMDALNEAITAMENNDYTLLADIHQISQNHLCIHKKHSQPTRQILPN